jgi:hypothetical protein
MFSGFFIFKMNQAHYFVVKTINRSLYCVRMPYGNIAGAINMCRWIRSLQKLAVSRLLILNFIIKTTTKV